MLREKVTFCGSNEGGFQGEKKIVKNQFFQSIDWFFNLKPQKDFSLYHYFWIL
jgi:hypothetical protein